MKAYAGVIDRPSRASSTRDDDNQDRICYNYEAIGPVSTKDLISPEDPRFSVDLDSEHHVLLNQHLKEFKQKNRNRTWLVIMGALGVVLFFYLAIVGVKHVKGQCDGVDGFTCEPEISRFWGQSSPYYSVPSEIATEVPPQCSINFVQMLSRHGARGPVRSKTKRFQGLISRIHKNAISYNGNYAFIKDYTYTLGTEQLTDFGRTQMFNSGSKFYNRYKALTRSHTPFVRIAGHDRVIESATKWTEGFHSARLKDAGSTLKETLPFNTVIISEEPGMNNSLRHGLCTNFEKDTKYISRDAQRQWRNVFAPPITARINANLPEANLTDIDTTTMMDLCAFETIASDAGVLHPFCHLFTPAEWKFYDYLQSLGKYYAYSLGNPLAPTQGVGFTNELIARLTNSAVVDRTTTNSTLTGSDTTFPLGSILYADFTHDNDVITILTAVGLFNSTTPMRNDTSQVVDDSDEFRISRVSPFSGRAYFEKMKCVGAEEEMVRVVLNDRVMPLDTCGGDELGRCSLSAFVDSLAFAREGGKWDECFT
ncbi:hypothetical protein QTJ16_001269 [Diplocarpon rosae]|uniref:3-phytase n=1 Tax=Diplocarpon rosae TaxID=946125 RepID=A0AAD9T7T4_9HELO|nr:hypothetical protein QTJ16_001269 [Diplocarpon rosae]PBP28819.1 histidine acid phosphatase [Diplocarpon rosae]